LFGLYKDSTWFMIIRQVALHHCASDIQFVVNKKAETLFAFQIVQQFN